MTGFALDALAARVWEFMQAREASFGSLPPAVASRQALVRALLGGFRAVAADLLWLQMSGAAEADNLAEVESLLNLVTEIDARPLYFWVNGARIMAYDMPAWRIAAAGGYDHVPPRVRGEIIREQAQMALRRLDDGLGFHPASAALWVERANIELNRLDDVIAAAESYRRASMQPGAPYYAARLHAELLRRLDRKAEALEWLIKLHPQLPPGDEAAAADLVLARIRDLERELVVTENDRYRPGSRAGH